MSQSTNKYLDGLIVQYEAIRKDRTRTKQEFSQAIDVLTAGIAHEGGCYRHRGIQFHVGMSDGQLYRTNVQYHHTTPRVRAEATTRIFRDPVLPCVGDDCCEN